jgi:cobyrinic acid a,c-diamide synthase
LKKGYKIPRIIVAGIASGVGKTTVVTGLIKALEDKGYKVQPFKVGPDFIDVSYHNAACKFSSRNLDTWLMNRNKVLKIFISNALKKDICIIEGVMGIFDGIGGKIDKGSTFEIAKLLQAPVILIIDVRAMSGSAFAIALGVKEVIKPLDLYVILNRVASEKHERWVKEAIEKKAKVKVIGSLRYDEEIKLEERHLGLIPYYEIKVKEKISKISKIIEKNIDLDEIVKIAEKAPNLFLKFKKLKIKEKDKKVKIAVAFDESINFYYKDSLEILEKFGADIHYFSLIRDKDLPYDVGGIYIGGGYPEVYAKELQENYSIRKKIKDLAQEGCPIYAECGGLMYLTKSIDDGNGKKEMVGIFDGETVMTKKLTLSYTKYKVLKDNPVSYKNAILKGHEFHYSMIQNIEEKSNFVYEMIVGKGILDGKDGWLEYNTLGSYSHINFFSNYKIARRFIDSCTKFFKK